MIKCDFIACYYIFVNENDTSVLLLIYIENSMKLNKNTIAAPTEIPLIDVIALTFAILIVFD